MALGGKAKIKIMTISMIARMMIKWVDIESRDKVLQLQIGGNRAAVGNALIL